MGPLAAALVCLRITTGLYHPFGEGWQGEQWPAWSDGGPRWEMRYIGWWVTPVDRRRVWVEGRWYDIGQYGAVVHHPSGTQRNYTSWPLPWGIEHAEADPTDCRPHHHIRLPLAQR